MSTSPGRNSRQPVRAETRFTSLMIAERQKRGRIASQPQVELGVRLVAGGSLLPRGLAHELAVRLLVKPARSVPPSASASSSLSMYPAGST